MHRMWSLKTQLSYKWYTHNPQQEYKWTIPQLMHFLTKPWIRSGPRPSTCAYTRWKTDDSSGNSIFLKIRSNQSWWLSHQAPFPFSPPTHTPQIPSHLKHNKPIEGMPSLRVCYFPSTRPFLRSGKFPGTGNSPVSAHSRAPDNSLQNPNGSTIITACTKYGPARVTIS